MPQCAVDVVAASSGGGVFVVGWVDDVTTPLSRITVTFPRGRVVIEDSKICRIRREDVEIALTSTRHHQYGYWTFVDTGKDLAAQNCHVTLHMANGASGNFGASCRVMGDPEIRDTALSYLAGASFLGNRQLKAIAGIRSGLGQELVQFNRKITRDFCANPYVETFGHSRKLKGSIIVCLYGKAEFMYLQAALFSGLPGIEDYEFIYVCNSPELSEPLLREAKINSTIYGINQTLVLLGGNAGFGAANNVAARFAHSNRLLIVNPDVFPYDREWAKKHTAVVASLPTLQTALFGAPLYYDDGSLMHGGMYFDMDTIAAIEPGRASKHESIRVEHYGKGSPPAFAKFLEPRPVPAVTGAFISVARRWFEHLEGFAEDFIFGHYEDADLCLKSLSQGVPAWIHDIKLWHLEGKGSSRRLEHEGGSVVNRWIFSEAWADLIKSKLLGPAVKLDSFVSSETLNDALRAPREEPPSVAA